MGFRLVSAAMATFFVLATFAQLNDPDPLRWVVGYGIAAALSAAAALNRFLFWPTVVACAFYVLATLSMLPTLGSASLDSFSSLAMSSPGDEGAREAVGLLICGAWSAVLAWAGRRTVGKGPV